jgi:hypothetical protein
VGFCATIIKRQRDGALAGSVFLPYGSLEEESRKLKKLLAGARRIVEAWRIDYNTVRPHGRLGRLPPAVFGATRRPEEQRGGTLRSIGGFAPRPIAAPTERAEEEQTQPADV